MHEASLMRDLIAKIEQLAAAEGARRITGVCVWLGALSHMSPAHFREHFDVAVQATIAAGAALEIETSDDIADPNAPPCHFERSAHALFYTGAACCAAFCVDPVLAVERPVCAFRAHTNAGAAPDAAGAVEEELGLSRYRFRVVTPQASQRAALEEDGGTDAGPIVY